jgi:hypothetical protein
MSFGDEHIRRQIVDMLTTLSYDLATFILLHLRMISNHAKHKQLIKQSNLSS